MTNSNDHFHHRETAGDRKRQRQAEYARTKAENEPIHLKPGETFQQQMSESAARTTPLRSMHNKGGKEYGKFLEEQYQAKPAIDIKESFKEKLAAHRQTVGERMGRVVRPSEEPDERRHDRGPKL